MRSPVLQRVAFCKFELTPHANRRLEFIVGGDHVQQLRKDLVTRLHEPSGRGDAPVYRKYPPR